MYTNRNFKTKKALKEAVAKGEHIGVFQPNDMFGRSPPTDGTVCVEGPHYPKPHTWYASVKLEDGHIVAVDGKRLFPATARTFGLGSALPAMTIGAVLAHKNS